MASPRTRRLKDRLRAIEQTIRQLAGHPDKRLSRFAAGTLPLRVLLEGVVCGCGRENPGAGRARDGSEPVAGLSAPCPAVPHADPVFHPNFDDATVCIGDFWAASEGLDDLVIRIGRMIAYQEYNTRSPLNGLAAKWAAEHLSELPIDSRIVAPPSDAQEAILIPPVEARRKRWLRGRRLNHVLSKLAHKLE